MKYSGSTEGPFICVGIDLDAPYCTAPVLSPLLHIIQPDLAASESGNLASQSPELATWIQPAPPPFSGPHRYLFILYKQPASFDSKKITPPAMYKRIRWSLADFIKQHGLGEPVAADWFKSG